LAIAIANPKYTGSGLLFSTWPAVEIGVGLIACNLPSLSFSATRAITKQIRHGWNLSLSGLRHAAERLSLRSRNKTESHPTKTGDDGTALDWSNSRHGSLGHVGQRGSVATVSHIPLVNMESKAHVSSEARPADGRVNGLVADPTENGNGMVIKGFDAV